ncbi:MAG: radical SAM protein [Methanomassiliicoccales archaeon]|nr:MAG: radical SAM protein [Methanomassiliicoccales archaeon]
MFSINRKARILTIEEIPESDPDYLKELEKCRLCEWECDVNRLEGETGVCEIGIPEVGHSSLHPAPPASYDAFMVGCNFRCLSCQNWTLAHYPKSPRGEVEGYYSPKDWAAMGVESLKSTSAHMIAADRLFFTGGEPTCSLPWVEEVVKEARKLDTKMRVNYDTNGFMTKDSLKRVLELADSITYDIKAYNDKTFNALTGAFVEPVLRNAETVAKQAKGKLWEFRILTIPGIHEEEVEDICSFIADIDETLPVAFLAFRPNFVMEEHHGAPLELMEFCVQTARRCGLENAEWSGRPGIKGKTVEETGSDLGMRFAKGAGCVSDPRRCGDCENVHECDVKKFVASRLT